MAIGNQDTDRDTIKLSVTISLGLEDMRTQKLALCRVLERQDFHDQHPAAEGLINLLDFLQDAIVDQGLATEQEVFGPDYGKDDDDKDQHEC